MSSPDRSLNFLRDDSKRSLSYPWKIPLEKYFSMIKKPAILKCFTNFRISSHKLSIEVDRIKNIPVSDRECRVCNSDNIEDESHFIFQCPAYDMKRKEFMDFIQTLNMNFSTLLNINNLIWLMSNESSDVIINLAEYIYFCFCIINNINTRWICIWLLAKAIYALYMYI